jgi:hypothetical protein
MNSKNEPSQAPHERTYLARWECPDCGRTMCGWITEYDNAPRRCTGIPKTGRTDGNRICGALMQCVFSERPRGYGKPTAPSDYHDEQDGASAAQETRF